jgi:transcriptional regulator with XRE-family HTH domain
MNATLTLNQGVFVKGYLKTNEVAERFGVDPRTVLRWVKSGHFPGTKKLNPLAKNSPLLIPEKSVMEFEQKQTLPMASDGANNGANN